MRNIRDFCVDRCVCDMKLQTTKWLVFCFTSLQINTILQNTDSCMVLDWEYKCFSFLVWLHVKILLEHQAMREIIPHCHWLHKRAAKEFPVLIFAKNYPSFTVFTLQTFFSWAFNESFDIHCFVRNRHPLLILLLLLLSCFASCGSDCQPRWDGSEFPLSSMKWKSDFSHTD